MVSDMALVALGIWYVVLLGLWAMTRTKDDQQQPLADSVHREPVQIITVALTN